jgi:hypothetical protein
MLRNTDTDDACTKAGGSNVQCRSRSSKTDAVLPAAVHS